MIQTYIVIIGIIIFVYLRATYIIQNNNKMVEAKYLREAEDLLKQHPYFILGKSWCPDVKYAINVLKQHGKFGKFYVHELDKIPNQTDALKLEQAFTQLAGGIKWVPSIFIQGKYWGNEKTLYELSSTDKLESTLNALII